MARGLINFDEGFSSKLITNVVKIKKRATKHSRPVLRCRVSMVIGFRVFPRQLKYIFQAVVTIDRENHCFIK
jgi:hypothetical protein